MDRSLDVLLNHVCTYVLNRLNTVMKLYRSIALTTYHNPKIIDCDGACHTQNFIAVHSIYGLL